MIESINYYTTKGFDPHRYLRSNTLYGLFQGEVSEVESFDFKRGLDWGDKWGERSLIQID